jgi:hypothetical protein
MEFRKNWVRDGGVLVKELGEKFKLSAAIEDFGVDPIGNVREGSKD